MHSTYAGRAVSVVIFLPLLFLPVVLTGQTAQVVPLKNWAAPLYWQPNQAGRQTTGRAAPGIRPLVTQISTGALTFVAIAPCRLVDTRGTAAGFIGPTPFSGPSLVASSTTTFPVQSAAEATTTAPTPCGTIPSTAQAYSFNITVVPKTAGGVDFITVWPAGSAQPAVSTLNDGQNAILANAAVVPAGTPSGGVNVINSGPATTDLIIDMNGYYAATGSGGGSITSVTAGTDLTGGGASGAVTLSLDTTMVPTLAGPNTFAGPGGNFFMGGSVGIGTATPVAALEVNGAAQVDGNVTASGNMVTTSGSISSSGNISLYGDIVDNGIIIYREPYNPSNVAVGPGAGAGSDSSGVGNTSTGCGTMAGNGGGSGCGGGSGNARPMPPAPRALGSGDDPHPDTSAGVTGSYNTAHGYLALSSLSNGYYNTGMGAYSLSANGAGYYNTADGYAALNNNTSGYGNSAVGAGSLASNTTGSSNIAVGLNTLDSNTSGGGNVAVGNDALDSNTIGAFNTAVGHLALVLSSTLCCNTAVGALALEETTGGANTAIGYDAGAVITTGSNDIAIGAYAGSTVTTGSNNIHIGTAGVSTDNGIIRIGGNTAFGDAANQKAFYASGIGTTTVSGVAVLVNTSTGQLGIASSSRRFKEDIHDMSDASDGLMRLRPVTFRYKQPFDDGTKPIQYGLIAEEVAEVYPELVARSADGQIETVKYQVLDPMLLNEVQKQNQHAQRQDETIRRQEEQIRGLEARLAALEGLLSGKVRGTATAGQ
jgi:hypothetical protein